VFKSDGGRFERNFGMIVLALAALVFML
jgi:hypothetical protein